MLVSVLASKDAISLLPVVMALQQTAPQLQPGLYIPSPKFALEQKPITIICRRSPPEIPSLFCECHRVFTRGSRCDWRPILVAS
ncbi:hypothetical protein BJX61DRAFT_137085 [Aspergillus egyptiacus]|nr:hypothetical protein BJX61DRAFT_137085 [Aspergillus egyptiacus]